MENPKNVTFAVKINRELKEQLENLFEISGFPTRKEWMESVVTFLQLNAAKENQHFNKEISELELHARRIIEIFAHMAQRTTFEREEEARQHDELNAAQKAANEALRAELADTKNALQSAKEDLRVAGEELESQKRQAHQFEEAMGNQSKLIAQLEKNNSDLTSIVSEYKEAADENKQLTKQIEVLQKATEELSRTSAAQVDEYERKLRDMEESQKRAQADHERTLQEKSAELERAKEDAERRLEREKADGKQKLEAAIADKNIEIREKVAELREEYQAKYAKQQEEATARIAELYAALTKNHDQNNG